MSLSTLENSEKTILCRNERFRIYLDRETIQERVRELGTAISRDYKGKIPILIGLLNGSFMFLADLMRNVTIECEVDFWKLSSYGEQKVSSGQVHELKKVDAQLSGRHILLVEDIVDTGLTMQYILDHMHTYKPASIRVVSLLHKPEASKSEIQLDYVGFCIPDLFVIGYGLDYGQIARNLPDIYILDE